MTFKKTSTATPHFSTDFSKFSSPPAAPPGCWYPPPPPPAVRAAPAGAAPAPSASAGRSWSPGSAHPGGTRWPRCCGHSAPRHRPGTKGTPLKRKWVEKPVKLYPQIWIHGISLERGFLIGIVETKDRGMHIQVGRLLVRAPDAPLPRHENGSCHG